MNLDKVQAELRPRLPWEAADFGVDLGRRYASVLLREWLKTAWLVWLLVIVIFYFTPMYASLLLWWLKPMMSVRPIFFVSRQLFGIVPNPKAARQALLTWLLKRAWADLTFARFNPRRGIAQIVRVLEGSHAPKARIKLFCETTPSWLIKGCLLFEYGLFMGLIIMVYWFGPDSWVPWSIDNGGIDGFFDSLMSNNLDPVAEFRFGVISTVVYAMVSLVSELTYIMSCFGCYLNTRTELEGWDLEIAFKRLSSRAARIFTPTALIIMLIGGMLLAPNARAQDAEAATETPEQVASRIVSHPDFTIHKETKTEWRWNKRSASSLNFSWLNVLVYPIAAIVIFAAVAGLVWLLVRYGGFGRDLIGTPEGPIAVAGLDVRPESLPENPLGTADQWWQEGRHREALSLLYRAALSWLIHKGGVEIEAGYTENECVNRVANTQSTKGLSHYFHQLTRAWLSLAYAQSIPSATTWNALCSAWPFQETKKTSKNSMPGTALLIIACGLLSGCGGKFDESEDTIGYRGAARYNPYLAVTRLSNEISYGAQTSYTLMGKLAEQEDYEYKQWLLSPSLLVNERTANQVLDRVSMGDHLLLAVSDLDTYEEMGLAPSRWVNDQTPTSGKDGDRRRHWRERQLNQTDDEEEEMPVFSNHIKQPEGSTGERLHKSLKARAPGVTLIMEAARVRFADEVDESASTIIGEKNFGVPDWDWPAAFVHKHEKNDSKAHRVLTVDYGDGWITFIPSSRPFTNLRLADDQNASLWYTLSDWHRSEVFFFLGTGASFLSVLWEYGWRAIIAAILALGLWLWAITKRFARLPPPVVPPPLDARVGLVATGGFLVRNRQVRALLAPWAESLFARWRKNQPTGIEPTQARFIAEISSATGLSEKEIADCFSPSERSTSRHFIVLAQRLWRISRAL